MVEKYKNSIVRKLLMNRCSEIFHLSNNIVIIAYLFMTALFAVVLSVATIYFKNIFFIVAVMCTLFNWQLPLIKEIYALDKYNALKVNQKVSRRFLFYLFVTKNYFLLSAFLYVFMVAVGFLHMKEWNFFFLSMNIFLVNLISMISELFASWKNRLFYAGSVIFLIFNFLLSNSLSWLFLLFLLELFVLFFIDKIENKSEKYSFPFLYRVEGWLKSTNIVRILFNKIFLTDLSSKYFILLFPMVLISLVIGKFFNSFHPSEPLMFLTFFQFELMFDENIENFEKFTEQILFFKAAKVTFCKRLKFSNYWDISRFSVVTILFMNSFYLGMNVKYFVYSFIECLFIVCLALYYFWIEEKHLHGRIKIHPYSRVLIPGMILSAILVLLTGCDKFW